jgi:hypothetical protein
MISTRDENVLAKQGLRRAQAGGQRRHIQRARLGRELVVRSCNRPLSGFGFTPRLRSRVLRAKLSWPAHQVTQHVLSRSSRVHLKQRVGQAAHHLQQTVTPCSN